MSSAFNSPTDVSFQLAGGTHDRLIPTGCDVTDCLGSIVSGLPHCTFNRSRRANYGLGCTLNCSPYVPLDLARSPNDRL
ncbi:MAG: hypothetical protein ABEK42_05490 [Thiohalorhabdaceae bacterium]